MPLFFEFFKGLLLAFFSYKKFTHLSWKSHICICIYTEKKRESNGQQGLSQELHEWLGTHFGALPRILARSWIKSRVVRKQNLCPYRKIVMQVVALSAIPRRPRPCYCVVSTDAGEDAVIDSTYKDPQNNFSWNSVLERSFIFLQSFEPGIQSCLPFNSDCWETQKYTLAKF